MLPSKHARHSVRSTKDAPNQTVSRPKRGLRGYRLYINGLLNATPIGAEIAM
jgi:hypothetical protein